MLESALAAGIAEGGGDAWLAGVLPTPAASILVRRLGLDLAAVVSASHNPWQDNGIKFFGPDGRKLSDELEAEVEAPRRRGAARRPRAVGRVRKLENAARRLPPRARAPRFDSTSSGRRSSSTARTARPTARRRRSSSASAPRSTRSPSSPTAATSTRAAARPTRRRSPSAVAGLGAELGFAFDGDGDRVIAVDGAGDVRDGDELISLLATGLAAEGALGGGVAVTVMSNFGFHGAMEEAGIEVATTRGRRPPRLRGAREARVAARRRAVRPHHLDRGRANRRRHRGRAAHPAGARRALTSPRRSRCEKLPQTLVNVRVGDRDALDGSEAVAEAVERESAALEGRGRVLLRPSGTEPLVRVMVEAPTRRGVRGGRQAPGRAGRARAFVSGATAYPVRPPCAASSDTWAGAPAVTSWSPGSRSSSTAATTRRASRCSTTGRSTPCAPSATSRTCVPSSAWRRTGGGRRRRRAAGDDRPRPHALGDARPGHRGERPPARRLLRRRPHRPQRHRREPRRASRRPHGRRPRLQLRDRRRDRRPPDRAPLRRRPHRGGPRGVRRPPRPLRVRRDARATTPARSSPPARSARS